MHPIHTFDESQRKAARVAGFMVIFEMVLGFWLLFSPAGTGKAPGRSHGSA